MKNREFLMLAKEYNPDKHDPTGWFMSEKLDGMRAFWDGGFTRGKLCSEIAFANTEKHARLAVAPRSTGLWTRYAQPIYAPPSFLDKLPLHICLDGELWMGRGQFQSTVSCCKHLIPGPEWNDVEYLIFDSPTLGEVLQNGRINNSNFKKIFQYFDVPNTLVGIREIFSRTVDSLLAYTGGSSARPLPQEVCREKDHLEHKLAEIESLGGEGVMLRHPNSYWNPIRSNMLLKVKSAKDMEGTVIGYRWGEETDKGSKLLGLMGSLRLRLDSGKEFDLSGFTDAERWMGWIPGLEPKVAVEEIGRLNPGQVASNLIQNPLFPVGSRVTFKFRELTNDGIPKEARYYRKAT